MFRWLLRFEPYRPQGVQIERMVVLVGVLSPIFAILFVWSKAQSLPCLLRELTGLPCPGCGGTRALRALVAGEIGSAFRWNPLVTLILSLSTVAAVYCAGVLLVRLPMWRPILGRKEWWILRLVGVVVLGLNEWYLIRHLG